MKVLKNSFVCLFFFLNYFQFIIIFKFSVNIYYFIQEKFYRYIFTLVYFPLFQFHPSEV